MTSREWFNSLQTRERYMLIGGGIALLLLVVYLWLIEPMRGEVSTLRTAVGANQNQLMWMQGASAEVQKLRRSSNSKVDTRTSLVSAVERTATKRGIRSDIKRLEPQGSDKISIEMLNTDFNQMMSWLGELESGFAAKTTQITTNKSAEPGRVDARIIVSRTDS